LHLTNPPPYVQILQTTKFRYEKQLHTNQQIFANSALFASIFLLTLQRDKQDVSIYINALLKDAVQIFYGRLPVAKLLISYFAILTAEKYLQR
jgi:hypothetical protein